MLYDKRRSAKSASPTTELPPVEPLLSISQLMAITKESESCWRKRIGRKEIPYIKLGANLRVRKCDFEAWLEANTVRNGRH